MTMVSLTIDGEKVKAERGTTILGAAQRAGIYIPALCAHPALPPFGACRLCTVEVEGQGFPSSCITPVAEGMVVQTDTPLLREMRRRFLGVILAEHPQLYEQCRSGTAHYELQKLVDYIGIAEDIPRYAVEEFPVEKGDPLFDWDYNLCISCGRCVRACWDVRGVGAISFTTYDGKLRVNPSLGSSRRESGCKYCGACIEVCPTGALSDKDIPPDDREAALVPCSRDCPAGIDVPRYVRLIKEGKSSEAVAVIREKVPFPGVLGYTCLHFCEEACRRSKLNEPIAIKDLKRYAFEHDDGLWRQNLRIAPPTGRRVAVVGSGPAGLTAAYYLAKQGHKVTVFEALPEPGGMMRVGIPEYRLPREVLNAEIEEIRKIGVDIKLNCRSGSLDELTKQGYNAIFIATGACQGVKMGVEGEDSPGVVECISLLRDVNLGKKVNIRGKVAVIGGGNAAIDAARTAIRLGASEVTIIYRRSRDEMPASDEEVENALEEGVKLLFLAAPSKITRAGRMVRMECLRMKLGKPDESGRRRPVPVKGSEFAMSFDTVIAAIGQVPEAANRFGLPVGKGNMLQVDSETLATGRKGVFAGGDVATGPASIIEAIAAGRKAAVSIDKYLGGNGEIDEVLVPREELSPYLGRDGDFADRCRVPMPCLHVSQRTGNFATVDLGFTDEDAVREAKRCLQCDLRLKLAPVVLPPDKAAARK